MSTSQSIASVITDITGLKHVNEQLREAEERYRTAAQLSDAMLWEVDIASKTLTLTGSVWKKFNYETLVFPVSYTHLARRPDRAYVSSLRGVL